MTKFLLWLLFKLPELYELYQRFQARQFELAMKELNDKEEQTIREAWEKQDAKALQAIFSNKPSRGLSDPNS